MKKSFKNTYNFYFLNVFSRAVTVDALINALMR